MIKNQKVFIIIPVHNRKQITLKCLEVLNANGDMDWCQVIIVDDGSTDGTSESIKEKFPKVHIIYGDGNLFWTGAISKGMHYAYEAGADFFVWLNDDTYPSSGTIKTLFNFCLLNFPVITAAQCLDPYDKTPTYGGIMANHNGINSIHAAEGEIIECEGLNGNLVCMPASVVKHNGYPNSSLFPHYHGDTSYTCELRRLGFKLCVHGSANAYCTFNNSSSIKLDPILTVRNLFNSRSGYYWKSESRLHVLLYGRIQGVWMYAKHRLFFLVYYLLRYYAYKIMPTSRSGQRTKP